MKRQCISIGDYSDSDKNRDPRASDAGFYFPLLGLLLIPLLILCGLAVDAGNLFITQLRLQRAVDAGGMRAIPELIDKDDNAAKQIAEEVAKANLELFGYDVSAPTTMVQATILITGTRIKVEGSVWQPYYILSLLPNFEKGRILSAAAVAGKPKLAIVLGLDRTGSMGQHKTVLDGEEMWKIDALRKAALSFYDGLESQYDALAIMVFSTESHTKVIVPFENGMDQNFIRAQLGEIGYDSARYEYFAGGRTNISFAFHKIKQVFEGFPEGQEALNEYRKHVIMMTDGIPNEGSDPSLVSSCGYEIVTDREYLTGEATPVTQTRVASDVLRRRGITIHAVGFGYHTDTGEADGKACPDPPASPFEPEAVCEIDDYQGIMPVLIRRMANRSESDDPPYTNAPGFEPPSESECLENWVPDCGCNPATGENYFKGSAITAEDGDDLVKAFEDVRKSIFRDATIVE